MNTAILNQKYSLARVLSTSKRSLNLPVNWLSSRRRLRRGWLKPTLA